MTQPQPITTEQQLRDAIGVPENEHLEFKEASRNFDHDKLFTYCVALANEGGGNLVLGVTGRQPRQIVGTSCFNCLDKIKHDILNKLRFRVDIYEILVAERHVLTFFCPPRPIGTPQHHKGRYLMRSGESLVPMTPDRLQRIFAEGVPDFSGTTCEDAAIHIDLASEAITEFRRQWVRKSGNDELVHASDEQLLEDAGLTDNGRVIYAALVLLGTPQAVRRLLPQAEVIFEYRNSDSVIECQDRMEYRAGFFLWHNEIWEKINARNETHSYRDGMFRYDIPAFNESVIREALLNATTPREYRHGGSIFVRQFPNRLEVVSPGGFPSGITADNITYRQVSRNRRIAKALQHCGLVERSGQGADRIFRDCLKEGKNRPDYTGSDDTQVPLVLDGEFRNPRFVQYLDCLADERNMSLTLDDLLVLDRVRAGEPILEHLNTRFLALIGKGVIEKTGRGRGVRHILSRSLYQHMGKTGDSTHRKGLDEGHNQQLVLQHIRNCGSKGATIGEFEQVLPNKTRPQISALLRGLKASGRIRVQGKTRAGGILPRQAATCKPLNLGLNQCASFLVQLNPVVMRHLPGY